MKLKGNFEIESDEDITNIQANVIIHYKNGNTNQVQVSTTSTQRRPVPKQIKKEEPDPGMTREY